jgi:hypothetical protein
MRPSPISVWPACLAGFEFQSFGGLYVFKQLIGAFPFPRHVYAAVLTRAEVAMLASAPMERCCAFVDVDVKHAWLR